MANKSYLDNKRILIVDDEPDVLDTVEELLSMCEIIKANSFNEAWGLLGTQYFDMAILDIMGVDGYRLLALANERGVMSVMLTAHALSPENAIKSNWLEKFTSFFDKKFGPGWQEKDKRFWGDFKYPTWKYYKKN
ncbi:MAG: response regulator [Deltaproteobacteria bacterium]|nr:response regulator [Deltaproteobacteria bacterium]